MSGARFADLRSQTIHDQQASFELFLPAHLEYFEGHFPQFPILPGLTQVKWATDFAEKLSKRRDVAEISRLKFMGLIFPETTITLDIQYKPEQARATFQFRNGENIFSQGTLIYRGH